MKKYVSVILSIILLCSGITPITASQAMESGGTTPQRNFGINTAAFISEVATILQENDSDDYFSTITLTLGEPLLKIDGQEISVEPALIENGELVLPLSDIATAIGNEEDLNAFNKMNYDRAPVKETEKALNVKIHKSGESVTITKPYQRKELIVQTTDNSKLNETFGAIKAIDNSHGLHLLVYASEYEAKTAADKLQSNPKVKFAEPNRVVAAHFAEPEIITTQSSLLPSRWGSERIAADRMKAYLEANGKTNEELLVAVIDTGIASRHPMFRDRISPLGYNFILGNDDPEDPELPEDPENPNDMNGHGSHVSGTIVDCTPSNVKILPIKALNDKGRGTTMQVYLSVIYAADNGAKVINMSYGFVADDTAESKESIALEKEAIDYAVGLGVTCVAAAGNDLSHAGNNYPAAYPNVITVSAIQRNDEFATFSNYGEGIIDIAAPGVNIVSAMPGNGYESASGTSMAAPHVSAAVAMLKLDNPVAGPEELKTAVKQTTDNMGEFEFMWMTSVAMYGAGILNLDAFFGERRTNISYDFTDPFFSETLRRLMNKSDYSMTPIWDTETAAFTALDISGKGIRGLAGIKHFTNLESLDVSNNLLLDIDVSNNNALIMLDCRNNYIPSQADVIGWESITDFKYHPQNQTTTIIIDTHPAAMTSVPKGNINKTLSVEAVVYPTDKVLTYQWYQCETDTNENGTPIVGATHVDYILPEDLTVGEHYYYCVVSAEDGTYATSNAATVWVMDYNEDITHVFTDLNFLWAVRNIVDKYEPLPILIGDVADIEYLHINSRRIESLNGIEYFANLQGLFCNDNRLTELDVSNNTKLITLWCQENRLTQLDVSKNTKLLRLFCDNNQLIELDVSNLSNLSILLCEKNKLRSLNVLGATALYELRCRNNQLTSLDISSINSLAILDCTWNDMPSPEAVVGWQKHFNAVGDNIRGAFAFYPQSGERFDAITFITHPAPLTTVTEGNISERLFVEIEISHEGITPVYVWCLNEEDSNMGGEVLTTGFYPYLDIPYDLTAGTYYFYCGVATSSTVGARSDVATVVVLPNPLTTPTPIPTVTPTITPTITPTLTPTPIPSPPAHIWNDFNALSLSYSHSAAIVANGDLYTWGSNIDGCLGQGDVKFITTPEKVAGLSDVATVSFGSYHGAAVTSNGDLYTWGLNDNGQLGHGDTIARNVPEKVKALSDVSAVSLGHGSNGGGFSAAITKNGDLYTWGENSVSFLGDGGIDDKHIPTKVEGLSEVAAISLGVTHAAAITKDGYLYTWGLDVYGQLGRGGEGSLPRRVSTLSNVVAVSLGAFCSAAITENGDLYTWGSNYFGQLGHGNTSDRNRPTKVNGLSDVVAVSMGAYSAAAITANGDLYSWGLNDGGQLGHGDEESRSIPTKIATLSNVVGVCVGDEHSAAVTANGDLYTWGHNFTYHLGLGDAIKRLVPTLVNGIPGGIMLPAVNPTPTHTPTPTSTPTPTPTPEIEKVEAFITRIYNNVLERDPEEDGLAFWSKGLKSNDETAASIIDNFFFGEEFLSKGIANEPFVKIAYLTFMDREAEPEGLAHWMNALDEGYNRRYVVDRMITSEEFADICAAYGITVGPVDGVEGFVARMYRDVLNVRFDRDGFDFWVNGLLTGVETGMTIAEEFFFSEGFYDRHVSNEAFIEIAYSALMNRDPESTAMAYWVDLLERGADRRDVIGEMISSSEFRNNCNDFGIEAGQLISEWHEIAAEMFTEVDTVEDTEIMAEEKEIEIETEIEIEAEENEADEH